MIKPADAAFHAADADKPSWAETNFFGFYATDPPLNIGVYTLFRPNLGVVLSTICMNSKRALTAWQADFCDLQAHLPIPEPRDLCNYKLANGLAVRCTELNMKWDIDYDDGAGTEIHVRYEALMEPFDIHDPDMDPMAASGSQAGKFAWGTAYNGHFDQTGRFKGEARVRGKRYNIDCISTMDHSWGPRPERGKPNMSWLHAHFSDQLAMHAILSYDWEKDGGSELLLNHGYVLADGKVLGLKRGRGTAHRLTERYAERIELELTDRNDRVWRFESEALTLFPWNPWPNMLGYNVLARWQCEGQSGYGEIQDLTEIPPMTRLNADPRTAVASLPRN
jgi:hypothetical protein